MFNSATSRSTFRSLIAFGVIALAAMSLAISWVRSAPHNNLPASQLAGQPISSDSMLRPPAPDHNGQPALRGQAAVAHLKQQGLSEPLREAVAASVSTASLSSTLTEQTKLTASDAALGKEFGYDVAISGDMAVVGARLDTEKGSNAGAAYIFRLSGGRWTQVRKLIASDTKAGDVFGSSVAINVDIGGTTVVVGAPGDNGGKGSA